jgi:uncharacterized protein (TIGR02646 family)
MISVKKPAAIPKKLLNEGKAADTRNRNKYDADPNSVIKITNKIYGHPSIKKILKRAQFDKCCFCEKNQKDENGAVEHFRPKAGYHSDRKEKLKKPGYYWLGYEWSNLFFVCSGCNSKMHKGNLFPLEDETKRAKSHHDDINEETPLLINPEDDPRKQIIFDKELPKGITKAGKKTIEICGLGREALNDMRKELINILDDKIAILLAKDYHDGKRVAEARQFIKDSQKPEAEFSATAIDYLKGLNLTGV